MAALWVLVSHCFYLYGGHWYIYNAYGEPARYLLWLFSSGWGGLDLFFFISGFLLYMSFGKASADGRPTPSVLSFYKRRFKRIAPAYYVSMAIIIALSLGGIIDATFQPLDVRDVLLHVFFLHNITPENSHSINGVYWTLAAEVQFYMVLPFMAGWFHGKKRIFALLGILAASSIYKIYIIWLANGISPDPIDNTSSPFNVLLWRIDQFAIGIFFAGLWLDSSREGLWKKLLSNRWFGNGLALVSLALVVAASMFNRIAEEYISETAKQVIYTPLMGFLFGGLVLGVISSGPVVKKVLANSLLQFVGIISYGVYLWHLVIISELQDRIPQVDASLTGYFRLILETVLLAVCAGLASYLMLERPFLRKKAILPPEPETP